MPLTRSAQSDRLFRFLSRFNSKELPVFRFRFLCLALLACFTQQTALAQNFMMVPTPCSGACSGGTCGGGFSGGYSNVGVYPNVAAVMPVQQVVASPVVVNTAVVAPAQVVVSQPTYASSSVSYAVARPAVQTVSVAPVVQSVPAVQTYAVNQAIASPYAGSGYVSTANYGGYVSSGYSAPVVSSAATVYSNAGYVGSSVSTGAVYSTGVATGSVYSAGYATGYPVQNCPTRRICRPCF